MSRPPPVVINTGLPVGCTAGPTGELASAKTLPRVLLVECLPPSTKNGRISAATLAAVKSNKPVKTAAEPGPSGYLKPGPLRKKGGNAANSSRQSNTPNPSNREESDASMASTASMSSIASSTTGRKRKRERRGNTWARLKPGGTWRSKRCYA